MFCLVFFGNKSGSKSARAGEGNVRETARAPSNAASEQVEALRAPPCSLEVLNNSVLPRKTKKSTDAEGNRGGRKNNRPLPDNPSICAPPPLNLFPVGMLRFSQIQGGGRFRALMVDFFDRFILSRSQGNKSGSKSARSGGGNLYGREAAAVPDTSNEQVEQLRAQFLEEQQRLAEENQKLLDEIESNKRANELMGLGMMPGMGFGGMGGMMGGGMMGGMGGGGMGPGAMQQGGMAPQQQMVLALLAQNPALASNPAIMGLLAGAGHHGVDAVSEMLNDSNASSPQSAGRDMREEEDASSDFDDRSSGSSAAGARWACFWVRVFLKLCPQF